MQLPLVFQYLEMCIWMFDPWVLRSIDERRALGDNTLAAMIMPCWDVLGAFLPRLINVSEPSRMALMDCSAHASELSPTIH